MNNKFGNTSQSIVTVPSSFLTHNLKPVELFTITSKERYFKERSLFAQARMLNINNNPVKNYRKFDDYNMKKYIPIHKLSSIPGPDNSFNPHYRREGSNQVKKHEFISEKLEEIGENRNSHDEEQLSNKFNIFGSINNLEEESLIPDSQTRIDFTKYKLFDKARYNKNFEKYEKLNKEPRRRSNKTSNAALRSSKSEIKRNAQDFPQNPSTIEEKFSNEEMNKLQTKTTLKTAQTQGSGYALINKSDKDYKNLEDYYNKGCFFGKQNFVKDFRLKIDNLIERINSNYDTEKWGSIENQVYLFNKMNDTMFTPITYYNQNHESESALFRYTLQKKIETLTLNQERKEALLEQFNKTTIHKEQIKDSDEIFHCRLKETKIKKELENSEYYSFQKTLKNEDYKRLIQYTLPVINETGLQQTNDDNGFLYEKYKSTKLYSGFPSATLSEYTKRNGEDYSNKAKQILSKEARDNFKKEFEPREAQEHQYNFQKRTKAEKIPIS